MADTRRASKRAKKTQPTTATIDQLTALLTTELSTQQLGRAPLRLATLVCPYLTVTEVVSIRSVSAQWHQLFSHAGCGSSSWSFKPTEKQLNKLARRYRHQQRFDSALSTRLGCQRNVLRSLPQLHELDLSLGVHQQDLVMTELLAQLADCHSSPLKKLAVSTNVSAELLKALPSLESLSLCIGWHSLDPTLHALMQHSPATLRHIDGLGDNVRDIQQLLTRCPQLTSIDFVAVNEEEFPLVEGEVLPLLAACKNIVILRIKRFCGNQESMAALCRLPNLRQLTLTEMCADQQFWEGVAGLREALDSRASPDVQVKLRITHEDGESMAEPGDDEWWHAASQAAGHCTNLSVDAKTFSDDLLEYDASVVEPRSMQEALVEYIRLHSNLSGLKLTRDHLLTDRILHHVLSKTPQLKRLHVSYHRPVVVHQALQASSALQHLLQLRFEVPEMAGHQLPALLQLVRAANKLREVDLEIFLTDWLRVGFLTLEESLQHVPAVRVRRLHADPATKPQQELVIRTLLLLPNLTALIDFSALGHDLMSQIRLRNHLKSVSFSAYS